MNLPITSGADVADERFLEGGSGTALAAAEVVLPCKA